jgi:predicted metal-dependent peptidase
VKTSEERELLDKVAEGFRRVGLGFPYLVGLIQKLNVQLEPRVETMGIFASGRLVINPDFVRSLSSQDLLFVLTHELYHLTLRTHERSEGTNPLDFNYAHDYIINDLLREELQVQAIPAGGLDWPGARRLSAEHILGQMQRDPYLRPPRSWDQLQCNLPLGAGGQPRPSSGEGPPGDVLGKALEKALFPEMSDREQQTRIREVQDLAARAVSLQALMESMRGHGLTPGDQENTLTALRGLYRPPWELALQRWLDAVAPSDRSYARPSRRGADRTDVVLPGRKREGWTLHIVLDTSGSMVDEIPRALGTIADFCEAVGVDEVHLIQCDTAIGSDEILAPATLAQWRVSGYGGSDLTPAMLRLGENPDVGAAIVLTDGEIDYPTEPVPYQVLWVLPVWKNPQTFTPRYGNVVGMTQA